MTAPNLEQTIAYHTQTSLLRHERKVGFVAACLCRWIASPASTPTAALALHAAHVVAVIRDSGYTVIALPEPTSSDDTGTEWLDGEVFVGAPGNGRVRCYLEDPRLSDDEAADLGAALIAASLTAQGDNP
jgi:hypothetical protein